MIYSRIRQIPTLIKILELKKIWVAGFVLIALKMSL